MSLTLYIAFDKAIIKSTLQLLKSILEAYSRQSVTPVFMLARIDSVLSSQIACSVLQLCTPLMRAALVTPICSPTHDTHLHTHLPQWCWWEFAHTNDAQPGLCEPSTQIQCNLFPSCSHTTPQTITRPPVDTHKTDLLISIKCFLCGCYNPS